MMRKTWILCLFALSVFASVLIPVGQIHASTSDVKVTLPTFKVTLNGHTVENQYRQYPLLVYRNITYIPMTWYDTRLLGLEAIWSPAAGLSIQQREVTSSYVAEKSGSRNAASYTAQIAKSAVTVNGKAIHNANETYPLLSFRNVTYFPLTWRFAHDEFGWEYKWNAVNGLSIASHNSRVQNVNLPAFALENDVTLFKGYYYFVEKTLTVNHIYRAPANKPSEKVKIYSYHHPDSRTDSDLIGPFSFEHRENSLWFTYRLGGGVMGSDYFVKIGEDGKANLVNLSGSEKDFRETPYGTVIIHQGASAFEGGNMYITPPGKDNNSKRLGDADVSYGVHVKINVGESRSPDPSTIVIGDEVYVMASHGYEDLNNIYKLNLKTNKSVEIIGESVSWFKIIGHTLYYVKDENNILYSSTLDGKNEIKLSEHQISWTDHIDGNLFYTTKVAANKFELYKVNPNGKDTLVLSTPVAHVQVINNRLVCQPSSNYGIIFVDESGSKLLEVAEPISRVLKSDEGVLLQSSRDSSIKFIR
ncbi:DUF5050 domain-containing protein [Paenibacillus sp. strain BS8-2]